MNAGLGNLTDLKRALLMPEEREGTDFDEGVQAIGLGVAAMFESYCGRRFARVVGDTFEFDAYRLSFVVPRYPIEAITSLELRSTIAEGFVVQEGQPTNFRRESGILFFGSVLGGPEDTARCTWTGGYWWDESEDGSGEKPAAAQLLPADLKLAWLQQSKFYWDRASIVERAKAGFKEGDGFLTADSELIATVKLTLDKYRRMG